jgi:hypothetical protein
VKELQAAGLGSSEKLSKAKPADLTPMFPDDKVAKQILTAAKRVTKKRAAGDDTAPSPKKKRKGDPFDAASVSSDDLEASIALPESTASEEELKEVVLFSNRAPLFLAFTVTLLKHTMPEQPLSSRLSLAQAFISTSSRSRAVSLGIQSIDRSEVEAEEQLAEGQPKVTIMGKELPILRRWGYEWRRGDSNPARLHVKDEENHDVTQADEDQQPALWALDLEALRKSNKTDISMANATAGSYSNLPIYTPQGARAYLLKAFETPSGTGSGSKTSAATKVAAKERNLARLLHALDLLYDSWATLLSPQDLDGRTWSWYVKVRPEVEHGVAGWGGKNEIKLSEILALRREV